MTITAQPNTYPVQQEAPVFHDDPALVALAKEQFGWAQASGVQPPEDVPLHQDGIYLTETARILRDKARALPADNAELKMTAYALAERLLGRDPEDPEHKTYEVQPPDVDDATFLLNCFNGIPQRTVETALVASLADTREEPCYWQPQGKAADYAAYCATQAALTLTSVRLLSTGTAESEQLVQRAIDNARA